MLIDKLKELRDTPMEAVKSIVRVLILKGVAILLGIVFVCWFFVNLYDYGTGRYACYVEWSESSIEYKYTYRGGCLLNLDKGWIPANKYRVD